MAVTELLITHNKRSYAPVVVEGMKVSTSIDGEPGKLTFELEKSANKNILFSEGDTVYLHACRFKGYIFEITENSESDTISVTAYDQMRYLKAKDTYVFTFTSAENAYYRICEDYKLDFDNVGYVKGYDTTFNCVCENMELIDMMDKIMEHLMNKTGKRYVLMDDKGSLSIRQVGAQDGSLAKDGIKISMRPQAIITATDFESYSYTSSIDKDTYNRVKVIYDNEDTGKRETFVAQDSNNIGKWGTLSTTETMQKGENGRTKANTLLRLYNHKNKTLEIKNILTLSDTTPKGYNVCFRAGQIVRVKIQLRDTSVQQWMMISKCEHTVYHDRILTNITVQGGDFGG